MWSTVKFFLIVATTLLLLTSTSQNYTQFAVYGELAWLGLYGAASVGGAYVDDTFLYTLPFIILLLTAVEAAVLWSIILANALVK